VHQLSQAVLAGLLLCLLAECATWLVRRACLQAVFDLEATNAELKSDLRDLYITKAEEIDGKSGRKAIIIHVRFPCQRKGLCRVKSAARCAVCGCSCQV